MQVIWQAKQSNLFIYVVMKNKDIKLNFKEYQIEESFTVLSKLKKLVQTHPYDSSFNAYLFVLDSLRRSFMETFLKAMFGYKQRNVNLTILR